MSFSSIPLRENGVSIQYSWFNVLRTAGLALESFLGSFVEPTSFTIANNQGSAANVTGLSFDGSSVKVAFIDYRIRRNTTGGGATERVQVGTLIAHYKATAATWTLTAGVTAGDDAGVEFTITNLGQIQYTSDNQGGTPDESLFKYTVRTLP